MGASSPRPGVDLTARMAALSRPRFTGAPLRALAAGSGVPLIGKAIRAMGVNLFDHDVLREVDLDGTAPYVPTGDPSGAAR